MNKTDKKPVVFSCRSASCGAVFSSDAFADVVKHHGIVHAESSKEVFQGITCPRCRKTTVYGFPKHHPLVDISDFIILPNPDPAAHLGEEVNYFSPEAEKMRPEPLRAKHIPAINENLVSLEEIKGFKPAQRGNFEARGILPLDIEKDSMGLQARLGRENETGTIHLRRAYPDTPKFRALMLCLSPNRVDYVIESEGGPIPSATGPGDWQERKQAVLRLIELALGMPLKDKVAEILSERGADPFKEEDFDAVLKQREYLLVRHIVEVIRSEGNYVGWESKIIDKIQDVVIKDYLYNIINDVLIYPRREELKGWINQIEKGKALFVDAIMGLGKTYSIIEVLATNSKLSAGVFFPTNKLCIEFINRLKKRIAIEKNIDMSDGIESYSPLKFKKKFLSNEVYWAEGINESNCINYNKIISKYKQNWLSKSDICAECSKFNNCKLRNHAINAQKSRIAVSTHAQYNRLYQDKYFRRWKKYKTKLARRNLFIIDEDIIISQCYEPIGLTLDEVKLFVATITSFIKDYSGTETIIDEINSLYGKIAQCDTTCIIKGTNADFRIPSKIKKEWNKNSKNIEFFIPESVNWTEKVGNHIDIIQNAIRKGLSIINYKQNNKNYHMILFPNPNDFNLKTAPPHVFFDGTNIGKKFIENKIRNVEYKSYKIETNCIWNHRIFQNINSDLPKNKLLKEKDFVLSFMSEVLSKYNHNNVLIITKKEIKEKYLSDYIAKNIYYRHKKPFIVHYGNYKGINEAKHCNVAIMLGSFLLSDAVEVAMAMDFLQDCHLPDQITVIKNNLWSWTGSKGQRSYKDKFAVVEELSKAVRFSEQRQALARSRYIFHDVDFYIISKDLVSDYDPYLSHIETDQYRADLFPPRTVRPDSKYSEVEDATFALIEEKGYAKEVEIFEMTKISRRIIREHLHEMAQNHILIKEGKRPSVNWKLGEDDIKKI